MADEYRAFRRPALLGELGEIWIFQRERCLRPRCRQRLSRRTLSRATELGGAGLSSSHLLQPTLQGRALCRLGTATTILGRGPRRLPVAALERDKVSSVTPPPAMVRDNRRGFDCK